MNFKMITQLVKHRHKHISSIFGIALALVPSITHAETVRLTKIDKETNLYLQRGLPWPDLQCYQYVLKLIDNPKAYYLEFDNPDIDGIAVGAYDSGDYYTCENGVLSNWDAGDQMIIKRFK